MNNYKNSGVNIDATNHTIEIIKDHAKSTFNSNVFSDIGGFGALFNGKFKKIKDPVLVASVDGVGTKLDIAIQANRHYSIGHDLLHHCINDILCQGAKPLFFMDYIAVDKFDQYAVESLIGGVIKACKKASVPLIGGEIAEMPGFYKKNKCDIAGFIVGVVEKDKIIDGKYISTDDVVIGLHSNGLHTNGYSLARKVLFQDNNYELENYMYDLCTTLETELLKIHTNYFPIIIDLIKKEYINGIVHITGGGLVDNIPRILPKNRKAIIDKNSWKVPPIFSLIKNLGNIDDEEMFRAFNMGIGMVIFVSKFYLPVVESHLKKNGQGFDIIGKVENYDYNKEKVSII